MMITSTNPMVYTDFPDPDIIRVGDVYYMATTTMHFTPGCDILRSYDLVHWEFIAHALNIVADTPEERLECEGANAYGRGMWAPSLRYHRGTWYVLFAANDTHASYLLTADDPCGPWRKRELDGFYYDSGLFFDDDDRAYVVHGQSTLRITELNPELSGPMPGGLDRVIVQDDPQADLGYEGSHLYKHDGRYYVFTCHFPQGKGKTEACLMAESLDGAFEVREIIDDDLSFHGYGVAQGGMVDTPDGDWYAFMMQDPRRCGTRADTDADVHIVLSVRWSPKIPATLRIPAAPAYTALRSSPFSDPAGKNQFPQSQIGIIVRIPVFQDLRPSPGKDSHLPVESGHLLRRILQAPGLGLVMVQHRVGSVYHQLSLFPHLHAVIDIIEGHSQLLSEAAHCLKH